MNSTKVGKYKIYFKNSEEFHVLKREIFGSHEYYAEFDTDTPYIIDAGAYLGLSVLYFKNLVPKAVILAIEPNPEILPVLEKNIFENMVDDVVIAPVALSDKEGKEKFYMDSSKDEWYSTAGMWEGAWSKRQESKHTYVETRRLKDFLVQKVDLLKMDIEGVEQKVIMDCGEDVKKIKAMMIEFHGVGDNSLIKLVHFLEDNGFIVEVSKNGYSIEPERVTGLAMIRATNRKN